MMMTKMRELDRKLRHKLFSSFSALVDETLLLSVFRQRWQCMKSFAETHE